MTLHESFRQKTLLCAFYHEADKYFHAAPPMQPRLSPSIVERLAEPVILLGARGEVRDFNTAARPLLRQFIAGLGELRPELAQAAANRAVLPRLLASLPCLQLDGRRLQGWLCECGDGLAAIFMPDSRSALLAPAAAASEPQQELGRGFMALFNTELREEIAGLRDRLEALAARHPGACAELLQPVQRVGRLLSVLEILSEVLHSPAEVQTERLSVAALLADVLAQAPGLQGGGVNATLSDSADDQGLVYGRAEWLRTALQALLDALAESTPPDRLLELRMRQHGNFLVITGSHGGARQSPVAPALLGSRLLAERGAVVGAGAGGELPGAHAAAQGGARVAALRLDAGVRLAVARMVVDFHGGFLRLQLAEGDAGLQAGTVDGFTLELPTGAPAERECSAAARARCIYPQQARALAQDLAQMLPRAVPDAALSSGEVSLLNELMRGLDQR